MVSLLQTFPLVWRTRDSWRQVFSVETEVKAAVSSTAFCMSHFTSFPAPLAAGLHFPYSFFCWCTCTGPFQLSLTAIARFNSSWALVFLISSVRAQTVSLYSSSDIFLSLLLLYAFVRSSLFIHTGFLLHLSSFHLHMPLAQRVLLHGFCLTLLLHWDYILMQRE